jgi:hypothetical protein
MDAGGYLHADAVMLCDALGARLCTPTELGEREAQTTGKVVGCGLNREKIWTSASCGGGQHRTAFGGNGGDEKCVSDDERMAGVRCCADA